MIYYSGENEIIVMNLLYSKSASMTPYSSDDL